MVLLIQPFHYIDVQVVKLEIQKFEFVRFFLLVGHNPRFASNLPVRNLLRFLVPSGGQGFLPVNGRCPLPLCDRYSVRAESGLGEVFKVQGRALLLLGHLWGKFFRFCPFVHSALSVYFHFILSISSS